MTSPVQGRQPRFRFTAGAARRIPLSEGEIDLNRYAEAGTFEVGTPLAATGLTLAQLNGIGKTDALIEGSNDGEGGYKPILKGVLDKITVRASSRPGGGVMVYFSGRDNTAKLIDQQRTEKSPNKSSADIVRDIAAKHGLKVDMDPTPGEAGQQHTQDFAHLIDNDSDWNTVAALAQREGAFLYISGDTLYFKQAGNDGGLSSYTIHFTPPTDGAPADGDVIEIELVENVHLAGGVTQTTRSYRTREEQTAESKKEGDGAGGTAPLAITEHLPGLTDSQVDASAAKGQIEAERHELQITATLPGDVNVDIRQMLQLVGTASAWDQGYFQDTLRLVFGAETGFLMTLHGKNKKGA